VDDVAEAGNMANQSYLAAGTLSPMWCDIMTELP